MSRNPTQTPGAHGLNREAAQRQRSRPFGERIVACVRSVAQQFDRLEMGVEQRRAGRIGVHEDRRRARSHDAPRLAQAALEVAPMMRAKSASQEVETCVGERQPLGGGLDGLDIVQSLRPRGAGDRVQHVGRQIAGGHHRRMARHEIGDVAAAGAEIERACRLGGADDDVQRVEVGPAACTALST